MYRQAVVLYQAYNSLFMEYKVIFNDIFIRAFCFTSIVLFFSVFSVTSCLHNKENSPLVSWQLYIKKNILPLTLIIKYTIFSYLLHGVS